MRKYIAIVIASLAQFTGQAHAQRCLPKMQGIEVRANMADGFNPGGNDGGHSFGAALSTYTKKGNKWVFGGEYLLKNNPYKDGKIPVAQFTAEGGYYFKILSDARTEVVPELFRHVHTERGRALIAVWRTIPQFVAASSYRLMSQPCEEVRKGYMPER